MGASPRDSIGAPLEKFFGDIGCLPRKLRVCQACSGIDYGESYLQMGVGYTPVNVYDIEPRCEKPLRVLFKKHHDAEPVLNMGPLRGDVLKVDVTKLEGPVDIATMGPPCPPWSSQGNKGTQEDFPWLSQSFQSHPSHPGRGGKTEHHD